MKKGFTLIEFLVVIAIIGILSTIVLSSLSSARDQQKMSISEYCTSDGISSRTVQNLPAKCLTYYQQGK